MSHKHIFDFSLHIADYLSELTLMEQAMVKKLLKNKDILTYDRFTIAYLADFLNVSTTSLHRLSKKLGYASFKIMKEDFFKNESNTMVNEESYDYLGMISLTYQQIEEALTPQMMTDLLGAKRITIYGMGMSSYIAKIFQIKLQLLGVPVEQYDDSRFMKISAQKLNDRDDIIIVLSRSGCPPELVQVMSEANSKKITSILITEAKHSPLKELATYVVETAYTVDEDKNIDTRIHAHIAMDLIIQKYLLLKGMEK